MTANAEIPSPVQLRAESRPGQPEVTPQLVGLYEGFEKALLVPLWTQVGELMPLSPQTKAQPHRWHWQTLLELAGRAGQLGGHPVPDAGGGRPRAPAHPERLPLRGRGRRGMDGRRGRPGPDAAGRLPAAG